MSFYTILKNNKGVTTTMFSWIFMSIIGGIFIFSTFSILQTYWSVETENNRIEFAKSLTNTLNVRAQSLGVQSATVFNTFPLLANQNARLTCIDGEFTRLVLDGEEIIYEPLNEYLDNFPFIMPPLDNELPSNVFLIQEDFNFPMSISPLVAVVPTRHLIIVNQDSDVNSVVTRVYRTKRSYQQLSFIIWDTNEISPDEMRRRIELLNPSSIAFVEFEENFIHNYINSNFGAFNFPVFHISIDFTRLPSYLDPSNTPRIAWGSLRYTYSNLENDFRVTRQNDPSLSPKSFNFYDMNDEISLLMFSFFSEPHNFECAYNSLAQKTQFKFNLISNKVDLIINNPSETNTTFCQSFQDSSILDNRYSRIQIYISNLMNSTHNLFDESTPINPQILIEQIEEEHFELRVDSCQLLY